MIESSGCHRGLAHGRQGVSEATPEMGTDIVEQRLYLGVQARVHGQEPLDFHRVGLLLVRFLQPGRRCRVCLILRNK